MALAEEKQDVPKEHRLSQWEELLRKFSEAHKVECKYVSLDIPRAPRSVKEFPTGSRYMGTWNDLGMSGEGIYTFPNGVIYEGEFEDGMFHGVGELRYPHGEILRGIWNKGYLMEKTLIFGNGLYYSEENWKYCVKPDRRFKIEYDNGLQPGDKPYLTNDQPTRPIPAGYYDTGDGFYDPNTKSIYKTDDLHRIIRTPDKVECQWIEKNCRFSEISVGGPRPELYEKWLEPELNQKPPPPPAACTITTLRKSESFDSEEYEIDISKQWSSWLDETDSSSSSSATSQCDLPYNEMDLNF